MNFDFYYSSFLFPLACNHLFQIRSPYLILFLSSLSKVNGLLPEPHSENLRPQISAFVISKTNETYYQDFVEIKAKEFFHPIYNWTYGLSEPSFHLTYLES